MVNISIQVGNITSKLSSGSNLVSPHLTAIAPGYHFIPRQVRAKWDGKIRLIDTQGFFPTGLLPKVLSHLTKYPVEIVDHRSCPNITLTPSTVPLRDYQEEAVHNFLSHNVKGMWFPRGCIKLPTGAGKTEVAVALVSMLDRPSLLLVNTTELLHQTSKRFAKYGIEVGIIGEGSKDLTKKITVCTIQSLLRFDYNWVQRKLIKRKGVRGAKEFTESNYQLQQEVQQFLSGIEAVVVDEAHLVASKSDKYNLLARALGMMPNAYCRIGLSATPFMREKLDNLILEGAIGPVTSDLTNRELIDSGYLSEAKVTLYAIPKDSTIPNSWPECYELGIVMNKYRNKKVIEAIKTKPSPTLIMVKNIDHGRLLKEMAKQEGLNIPFVSGKDSSTYRNALLEDMRAGRQKAVICSTIWDQGVDIDNLRTIILAAGGKGQVKQLQRLGRGLRKAQGKSEVEVVDFYDPFPKWLRQHSNQRKSLWESQGFQMELIK